MGQTSNIYILYNLFFLYIYHYNEFYSLYKFIIIMNIFILNVNLYNFLALFFTNDALWGIAWG